MHRIRLVVAAILALAGVVWIAQGTGFLPGSAMSGVQFWAVAGVVALGAGVYLAWDTLRKR
jgi:hypothetical protein